MSRVKKGGTLALSWGDWGGFCWDRGYCLRICAGWFAVTYIPQDFDELLDEILPPLSGAQGEALDLRLFMQANRLSEAEQRRAGASVARYLGRADSGPKEKDGDA